MRPLRFVLVLLLASSGFAGCGKANKRVPPQVEPVVGIVRVDGKPAVRVDLVFHRQESETATPAQGVPPTATSGNDGSFRPTTYTGGDGLPVGKYIVTAGWPQISVVGGEEVTGADRLGRRYEMVARPAARITINPGNNELAPIELKSR